MSPIWPLETHAELASTSAWARTLVAEGRAPPFVVQAARQTAGRGRRGTNWESPLGGLYMTFVTPPEGDSHRHGVLPLKAAVLLGRWLKSRFGFTATLKWPNDLVFAGRKLGGLLLEGAITGNKPGPTLVGLGLNVNVTPAISGDYPAVSLKDIVGSGPDREALEDLDKLAEELSDSFCAGWHGLQVEDVAKVFAREALVGPGHPFVERESASFWRVSRIKNNGNLELVVMEQGEQGESQDSVTLSSVDHGFTWAYLGSRRDQTPMLVADVGNTAIKIAHFARATNPGPDLSLTLSGQDVDASALKGFRERTHLPVGWPLFVLSVDREASRKLGMAAAEAGLTLSPVGKSPLYRRSGDYDLGDLGPDRFAAMEGWLARKPEKALGLLISAGTATTLDAITREGHHVGGLILPGLQTALSTLAERADLLPTMQATHVCGPGPGIGTDTRTAMGQGARLMTLAAVERFEAAVLKKTGFGEGDVERLVTGGLATVLVDELRGVLAADLILDGIRTLALGGRS